MQHSNDKSETNHKEGNTPNIVFLKFGYECINSFF